MKRRKPRPFTVRALSVYLRRSRSATLTLIARAGIELEHTEKHYTDDRPRKTTRREYRSLTPQEVDRVLEYVRAKQGRAG